MFLHNGKLWGRWWDINKNKKNWKGERKVYFINILGDVRKKSVEGERRNERKNAHKQHLPSIISKSIVIFCSWTLNISMNCWNWSRTSLSLICFADWINTNASDDDGGTAVGNTTLEDMTNTVDTVVDGWETESTAIGAVIPGFATISLNANDKLDRFADIALVGVTLCGACFDVISLAKHCANNINAEPTTAEIIWRPDALCADIFIGPKHFSDTSRYYVYILYMYSSVSARVCLCVLLCFSGFFCRSPILSSFLALWIASWCQRIAVVFCMWLIVTDWLLLIR